MFRHTIELSQAALNKAPKRFNTIDMATTPDELIAAIEDRSVAHGRKLAEHRRKP